jgi:hypothetical protein
VLDAAAVDARRRLVLIRRDDVEHLIMIGGPTDIVVESRIVSTVAGNTSADDREAAKPAMQARPQAPQRVAVPPVEPRPQSREAVAADGIAREAAARPVPVAASTAARPLPAARSEPVNPPMPPQPVPANQRQAPVAPVVTGEPKDAAPATAPTKPAMDTAANALDAVRARVLQERTETARIIPVSAAAADASLQQAADKPKVLGSDFEKILEEEMASNLAIAGPQTGPQAAPVQQPGQPAAAASATPEASLQDEVARIFGDISVTRDK